jgi:hypothetical protein
VELEELKYTSRNWVSLKDTIKSLSKHSQPQVTLY